MKTPESLCLPLKTRNVSITDDPLTLTWNDDCIGVGTFVEHDTYHIVVPSKDVDQKITITVGAVGHFFGCPDCKRLTKCLWLPPYGRHFACAKCWNVGPDEQFDAGEEPPPLANLLKKWLKVMQ